jgi:hypothetical protein
MKRRAWRWVWTGWRQSGAQRAPRVFSGVPFGRQPEDFQGAKARAVNQMSIGTGAGVSDTRKEAQRGV